ncbi:hypothetical protein, partial [Pseudomonas savastanoi]|uniref:hypothetical protein n=1 Tax=Pseudomonas savastanoi TaxID=29438 RepID=UPI001A9E7AFF
DVVILHCLTPFLNVSWYVGESNCHYYANSLHYERPERSYRNLMTAASSCLVYLALVYGYRISKFNQWTRRHADLSFILTLSISSSSSSFEVAITRTTRIL